jgi:hypothetical protein
LPQFEEASSAHAASTSAGGFCLRAGQTEGKFMKQAGIALAQSVVLTLLCAGIVLGIVTGIWELTAFGGVGTAVMAIA